MPQETVQQEAEPEEKGAEEDEGEKGAEEASSSPGTNSLIGPEAVIMLTIFAIIDIIDLFTLSFWIADVPALVIFFVWTTLRSKGQNQGVVVSEKAAANLKKVATKAKKARWLKPLAVVIEFIPVVGVLPCWVLAAYFELTE